MISRQNLVAIYPTPTWKNNLHKVQFDDQINPLIRNL